MAASIGLEEKFVVASKRIAINRKQMTECSAYHAVSLAAS